MSANKKRFLFVLKIEKEVLAFLLVRIWKIVFGVSGKIYGTAKSSFINSLAGFGI